MRSIFLRLLASAPLCALGACATDSATRAEVDALRAELRLLRERQARMDQRVEKLEVRDTVSRARATATPAPTQAPAAAPAPAAPLLPDLAVVKLKPKAEPAPALATQVPVVEPEPDDMEAFISPAADSDDAPAASAPRAAEPTPQETALADAEFDQAVAALRTGSVEGGVARLQRFADGNPRHPRADNALYFSGLGMIGLKDHAGAARLFERLIADYPAGDAVTDGMLRLAECHQRLEQPDHARALYTRLVTQFPGTAAASQAEQRLAALPR